MAEAQTVLWNGYIWDVTRGAHCWKLTRTAHGRLFPYQELVPLAGNPTIEHAVATLEARALAAAQAERAAYLAAQATRQARTSTTRRCPRCRATGPSGAYPFSTGYPGGLCDDCGG